VYAQEYTYIFLKLSFVNRFLQLFFHPGGFEVNIVALQVLEVLPMLCVCFATCVYVCFCVTSYLKDLAFHFFFVFLGCRNRSLQRCCEHPSSTEGLLVE